jgi:DNA primase
MPGLISEDILSQIQDRCDIVEVISGYLPLKRAGRNFKTLCPFHHEKTASFVVNPDKQIYHCFGCGAGGNVFNFLMRHEKMEFPEAVEHLAKKAGVAIPQKEIKDKATLSLYEQLYNINEATADFYHQFLLTDKSAQTARDYLAKRKIDNETVKRFNLGFAPDKWDGLINHLREKKFSLNLLEKAGLIVAREKATGYYDRFRNRIIFPVFDVKSRCIAFGARVLDDSLPKYINSPETPVYVKGNNLYGLNLSREAIREADFAIIVEGYMDFITVFQSGIENIIASAGTALTVEQVRILKRSTHNVVLLFDADQAGVLATLRSLDIFLEEGMNVKVTSLDSGDPDSFIRKSGAGEFKEKIKGASSLFDYKLGLLFSKYNHKEIEGKAKICSEMLPTVNKFRDAVLRFGYLKKLADSLGVSEEALRIEISKIKEPKSASFAGEEPKSPTNIRAVEKTLVKLMLEEDRFVQHLKEGLESSDFQDPTVRRIVDLMFSFVSQGKEVNASKLISCFDDEVMPRTIAQLCAEDITYHEDKDKIFHECVNRLKQDKKKDKCRQLQGEIKLAECYGDKERLHQLMHEYNHLIKG